MKYNLNYGYSVDSEVFHDEHNTVFTPVSDCEDAAFWVDISLTAPIKDTYIMLPACAYDGNRFNSVKRRYPPMFTEEEFSLDADILMTGVPRLSPDGDSFMDVTTGDLSSPHICLFSRSKKEGLIISTCQETGGLNLGITLEQKGDELLIRLRAPAKRRLVYRWTDGYPSLYEIPEADLPLSVKAGEEVTIPHVIETFPCESITAFYAKVFEVRYSHPTKQHNEVLPFSAFWKMSEDRANADAFIEGEDFYRLPCTGNQWQAGWVGGGMQTLPLICEGSELSRERSVKTLEFAARYQSKAGWYYGIVHNSTIIHDCFGYYGNKHNLVMVRKHADLTYFMWKQIYILKKMGYTFPVSIIKSAEMASDALVTLWKRYGQLGQFINAETGEIKVGNSTSGSMTPGALCAGFTVTGNEEYLRCAQEIGEFYYGNSVVVGLTTGGPGEILSAPDSESCAALLESYIALYEADNDPKWLEYAKDTANQLSTWVVNYEYRFPEDSKFAKLGVNSCGSVWANVQNKHSAPGLCTLSPAALFKLYRATGCEGYLTLMYHISNFMPQVASTPERPVLMVGDIPLQPAEMCERVNLSDWEGRENIGDSIFGTSSWPEISLTLTWLEIPGVYVDAEKNTVCVSDHVDAWLEDGMLKIKNNTIYDAEVKVMFEKDTSEKLGLCWQDKFTRIKVSAGTITEVALN